MFSCQPLNLLFIDLGHDAVKSTLTLCSTIQGAEVMNSFSTRRSLMCGIPAKKHRRSCSPDFGRQMASYTTLVGLRGRMRSRELVMLSYGSIQAQTGLPRLFAERGTE